MLSNVKRFVCFFDRNNISRSNRTFSSDFQSDPCFLALRHVCYGFREHFTDTDLIEVFRFCHEYYSY